MPFDITTLIMGLLETFSINNTQLNSAIPLCLVSLR
jgi:hypothetical protein